MKQNKVFFAVIIVLLSASVSFGAKQNTYPTKATPVGADKALIVDSVDNSTKQANLNAMRAALGLATTDNVTFGNVTASGGSLVSGVANTTQGALILYTNTDPLYYFGITPAASPTAMVSLKAPPAMPTADNSLWNCDINGTCGWTDPATFATPTGSAASMTIDASGFNGNLATTDNTIQEIAQKMDDLVIGAGGYTNLTEFLGQTAWRLFYSDGSGDVKELPLGSDGEYLKSNGAALAPSWATPSGAVHDAVTLDANLGNNLLGLSTQQLTLDSQTANYVFAAPNGSAGVPSFRALVAADVPTLNQNTTGTAAGLTAQYVDWNSASGGASIANKPTIPTVSDTAYGAGWNGDTGAASKNAIYDKIELIAAPVASSVTVTDSGNFFTGTNVETVLAEIGALPTLAFGTGLTAAVDTPTAGTTTVSVTANTYQAYDANMIIWPSTISATEVGYLNGLTEALSTSLSGKQAADADLTTYAGITPSANVQSLLGAATYAAMRTLLDIEVGIDFNAYDSDITDLADGSLTGSKVAGYAAATASKATSYTIGTDSANESYGGTIYVTSATTITAPAVAAGMNFSVVTIGDIAVSLDVNASDKMILDGVTLADGDKATNSSKAGDTITCQYYSADGWYCWSGTVLGGHWTDMN